jgi:Zn-dependent peptidase ImmA (M78 family)
VSCVHLCQRGYCQYDDSGKPIKIAVDPILSPLHKAKTLAHEIGHSLLHSCTEYLGHSTRSEKELEAESVAFVVLDHFGLDTRLC